MTILSATHSSRIRNRSMGVLHLIAADESCEVSDILALIGDLANSPSSSPSQPPQSSQAPAARMSEPATPDMQAGGEPHEPSATPSTGASQKRAQTATGPDTSGDNLGSASRPMATAKTDVPDHQGETSGVGQSQDDSGVRVAPVDTPSENADSVEPPPSEPIKKRTRRDTLRQLAAEHPDWTAKDFADEMGISDVNVRTTASHIGLKLPKASTKAERAKAATTEALKAAPAKPQEPIERAGPPTPRSEPKSQPASKSEAAAGKRLGRPPGSINLPDENGTIQPDETVMLEPQAMRRQYRPGATTATRFYLRDKDGRYVHQSLQASPTGPGPMMTSDRKWAWFDTMDRYRGAKKLWPEIADMRKEAAAS